MLLAADVWEEELITLGKNSREERSTRCRDHAIQLRPSLKSPSLSDWMISAGIPRRAMHSWPTSRIGSKITSTSSSSTGWQRPMWQHTFEPTSMTENRGGGEMNRQPPSSAKG